MTKELSVHATVTHHFSASPEKVFDAWLDTVMIGRFMFGHNVRDEEIINLQADTKVGGSFSFVVRRKDIEIDHIGEYLKIDRPHHLVFTWAVRQDLPDSSIIVIDISPTPLGAQLTLTQEMPINWKDYTESVKSAWTKMLDALDKIISNKADLNTHE